MILMEEQVGPVSNTEPAQYVRLCEDYHRNIDGHISEIGIRCVATAANRFGRMATMKEDVSGRRQRAVMATDAEWERIGRAATASGMDLSRFVIHRALDREPLPPEVLRRAVRELLVLSRLEERRLREAGAGEAWEDACDAVDEWIDREGMLDRLTDPGAANRWKAAGPDGEAGP